MRKAATVKKIITLLGLVLLSHVGPACANNTGVMPFLDSDCDNYFSNQSGFIVSPEKKLKDNDFKTLMAAYITQDNAYQYFLRHFLKVVTGYSKQVNLYCFAIPRVIEAALKRHQPTLKMAELPLPSSPATNGAAMCCFMSYPFERLAITV